MIRQTLLAYNYTDTVKDIHKEDKRLSQNKKEHTLFDLNDNVLNENRQLCLYREQYHDQHNSQIFKYGIRPFCFSQSSTMLLQKRL